MNSRTARRTAVATAVVLAVGVGTASAQAPAYEEGAGFLVLDNDYAEPAFSPRGAVVRIRNPQAGEQLRFTRQNGVVSGTYDSGTGILTLRGRASGANYARALESIWYRHHGDRPARRRVISIRLRRPNGRLTRATRFSFAVAPVNDAPRMAAPGRFEYRPGGGPQAIAPGMALLDPDSRIGSASVQISSGFSPAEDALVFENQRGITGTYDSGTGILTLTGTASPAAYQAALRSVAYSNSSAAPANPSRTFTFSVTDRQGATSVYERTSDVAE